VISNVRITFPKKDEAVHRSYWQTVRRDKDGRMVAAAMGRSEDHLVKRNGAWLIQSRTLTVFTEVTLSDHHREDFVRFEAAIRGVDEILECHLVSGGYDYLLKFTTRGVKMAVERGLFPGPRMRIAVTPLSQTGGHGDSLMPSGVNVSVMDPERPIGVVDGIDNIRRVTREVLRAGADQIKIMTSGGVLSPNDEPGATGFSPEEIAAVVYEAHAAGKTVMSHAQAMQGIKNAVVAGVESIEHGIYLSEEICAEMKKRGTYLVATLVAPLWVVRRAEKDPSSMPPYAIRKAKEVAEAHTRSFRMAVEKGVRIAMGTDTGVGPHGSNAEEIAVMVENGMTPMQAIVATTKTAAECARVDKLVGTIEPGKRADLVGLRGDPLANIALFKDKASVAFVMKDGVTHKRT